MKRHILIFAKTNGSKTPYDQWLAGTDIEPIILASSDVAASYRHMPLVYEFAQYDKNELVEKTALKLARTHSVVGIFARAEADIIRAAQLRQLLGLPGQHVDSALAFRNKVIMKSWLRDSGVELPEYRVVDSAYSVIEFVAKHGYPVVIKPFAESGSFGTQIIRDEAALDEYLKQPKRNDLEIETFVDGQMYHVDGLVLGGELVFVQPFEYVNDCLSFRKNEFVGSCSVAPTSPVHAALVETTKKVLAALPSPRNMAFHCELWRTPDGRTVFCEIASRTGGGMISSSIARVFGIDFDQEWLYAECGLDRRPPTPVYRPGGSVIIPPLDGVLDHLPRGNEPDCVVETQIVGAAGQRFHGGVKSGLFLAGYVVVGADEAAVRANMTRVASWFAANAKWRLASEANAA